MHWRRLTGLTNAFSKKLENFKAAVALNFAYYNFCKRHITARTTPAVAAGVENHEWTVGDWLKPVANKADYIIALQEAIWQLHQCRSAHIGTVHVNEQFQGKTVWDGEVEVFKLHGHPKAWHAYAWARLEGKRDKATKFVTVLELPQ